MLNQYSIDFADSKRPELKQYCKSEHVTPEALVCAGDSRKTMKFRLETAVFHLLQRFDKRLDVMISRLIDYLEHNGRVQRPVS